MQLHSSTPSARSSDGARLGLSKCDPDPAISRHPAATGFRVLIVDRDSMSSDLLASALTRDRNCRASAVPASDLLSRLKADDAEVVVIGAELEHIAGSGFDLAQAVSRAHPSALIVILLNQASHQSVLTAFRSGARGVFARQDPLTDFLDCVEHVRKGFMWAGRRETTMLLDAIKCIPSPDFAMANQASRLTERELDVVRCAATGKTNKVIASELSLSEHTVKNYLFRAFEKLGVSNRIELLFYLTLRGHECAPSSADDPEGDLRVG